MQGRSVVGEAGVGAVRPVLGGSGSLRQHAAVPLAETARASGQARRRGGSIPEGRDFVDLCQW